MRRRHPIPRLWLMTDERLGDDLLPAIRRMPPHSGIIFRHYTLPSEQRRLLFAKIRRIARARELLLVRAGDARFAGEMGTHGRRGPGVVTRPAHSRAEAVRAVRCGADAVFVSPVFATRSHPGAAALGRRGAARIARGLPVVTIALGGMDARRFARIYGFDGWAGIDAWSGARSQHVLRQGQHQRNK